MAGKEHLPLIDEPKTVKDWREGYQPIANPLPGVNIEEIIEDQPMGRTPMDDLRDGEQL